MNRRRDANDNSEASERAFRDIVRLAYKIRRQRWTGNIDRSDAIVLHDALLEYYPQYRYRVEDAAHAKKNGKGIVAFNIASALKNHRDELRVRKATGSPYRGPREIFHEAEAINVFWIDSVPVYPFGGPTWRRHGIIVFASKKMIPIWNPRWTEPPPRLPCPSRAPKSRK